MSLIFFWDLPQPSALGELLGDALGASDVKSFFLRWMTALHDRGALDFQNLLCDGRLLRACDLYFSIQESGSPPVDARIETVQERVAQYEMIVPNGGHKKQEEGLFFS